MQFVESGSYRKQDLLTSSQRAGSMQKKTRRETDRTHKPVAGLNFKRNSNGDSNLHWCAQRTNVSKREQAQGGNTMDCF